MKHVSLDSPRGLLLLAPLAVTLHAKAENSLLADLLRDMNELGLQTNPQQSKDLYLDAFSIYEGVFKRQ